jgi:hypothetical protein
VVPAAAGRGRRRPRGPAADPHPERATEDHQHRLCDPARTTADGDHFARRPGEHPAIIVVCADLAQVHPTGTEPGRLPIADGARIYPVTQNPCLALRAQGAATTFTTLRMCRTP